MSEQLEIVAETLNRLPFVRWDRFVSSEEVGFKVYGWIGRDDGRSDFVLAEFPHPITPGYVGFTTSSDRYSEEISRIVYGQESDEHIPCQRVEHVFGDLIQRKVVLPDA